MAFNDREISNESGQPVGLYEFRLGTHYWRYTSADRDIEFGEDEDGNPIVWAAKAISHQDITQGGSDQNDLQMPIQSNVELVNLFRANSPADSVWLTIRRLHRGDTDAAIVWLGTVNNVKQDDEAQATIVGTNIAASFDRNGLRLFWGRNCPHALYGRGCRVDPAAHAYPRLVAPAGVAGTSFKITVSTVPAEGSFSGGYVEWTRNEGGLERRGIEVAASGTEFFIFGLTDGLTPGMAVTLYPGCARTTTNCKLFDNLPNYGGFPQMPGKSPFDGTPVF